MSGVQNALACNVQPPQMLYVRDFIMFECSATSPPRVKGCRGFSPTQPEKKRLGKFHSIKIRHIIICSAREFIAKNTEQRGRNLCLQDGKKALMVAKASVVSFSLRKSFASIKSRIFFIRTCFGASHRFVKRLRRRSMPGKQL